MSVADVTVDTATEVPLERLEAEITELAGHLAATQARWLGLVAEYDRRQGWASWEGASCAQWLAWKCGLGRRAGTSAAAGGRTAPMSIAARCDTPVELRTQVR